MTTDAQFGRDMMYLAVFALVALLDTVLWRSFVRRHPPEQQRPGDVGQLASNGAAGCLLAALGFAAIGAVFVLWVTGW